LKIPGEINAPADLDGLSWPTHRLGEALEALADKCGLPIRFAEPPVCDVSAPDNVDQISSWIETVAVWMGFEVEPTEARYAEVKRLLRDGGPMLVKLHTGGEPRFLAIISGRGRQIKVLDQNRAARWIPVERARSVLCWKFEAPMIDEVNRLLEEAKVPRRRHNKARRAILAERLVSARFSDCWLLQMPPTSSFMQLVRREGSIRKLISLTGSYLALYLLWILSWFLVGRSAFAGHFDRGWFVAWSLALITIIPLRCLSYWSQASLAIRTGGLLKRRLLSGALRLDTDEVRRQGTGQLMGRVIESEAVESLAMSGGFLALFAGIELILGMWILWAGAGGWLHVWLLLGWLIPTFLTCRYYYLRRLQWTTARLGLTEELIERMVGYRTRIAQEEPEHWHDGEDRALEQYVATSKTMDRWSTVLTLMPRGWLIIGLAGLSPSFIYQTQTPVTLAITLGGIIFCYRAFGKIALGISNLAGAAVAWKNVGPLFHQATQQDSPGLPAFALARLAGKTETDGRPLMEVTDVAFHYASRNEQVLRGCSLRIFPGDRLLVEGSSGSGKSTLASILTGLRLPERGLVLIRGLDRQTLGSEGWRQRVVAAPQFHENHVLTETFAFNLLMGRRWPPRAEDFREAKAICDELGLANLLKRMPAGMLQMVGETGWQLSHGERSRLYIARALLQGSDLVVLDESFASLDPETLLQSFRCVLQRAATVLVIAHP
jgi:ATP-binding cassette, subfamily B, bacterial